MILKLLAFIFFRTNLSNHAPAGTVVEDGNMSARIDIDDPEEFLSLIGY